MNKFRASYTVLSYWTRGDWERAVKTYFKLEKFITPGMKWGKELHEEWQKEIIANKSLPGVFGGKKLNNPMPEEKRVVQIHDWLELVGVVDCMDSPVIYEFKSGKSDSEHYAGDWQVGVYGVLATLSGVYVDRAEIYHYDQYSRNSDMSIVHITDKLLKDSMEWIETGASEMHSYLSENGLYERFQ